jgi:hypothetical protein
MSSTLFLKSMISSAYRYILTLQRRNFSWILSIQNFTGINFSKTQPVFHNADNTLRSFWLDASISDEDNQLGHSVTDRWPSIDIRHILKILGVRWLFEFIKNFMNFQKLFFYIFWLKNEH